MQHSSNLQIPKDQLSGSQARTVMLSGAKHLWFYFRNTNPEILRFTRDDSWLSVPSNAGFGSSQPRLGILPQPIPKLIQMFFYFRFDSVQFWTGESFVFGLAPREQVIFYFRLCA